MKKIQLTKTDSAETAVIKLLKTKDDQVIFVIPNFSRLATSLENFHSLKQEADEAGKELAIESVDDIVVEFAKRAGIKSLNPFFGDKKKNVKSLESERGEVVSEEVAVKEIKEDISPANRRQTMRATFIVCSLFLLIVLPAFYVAYAVLPRADIKIVTQKMNWDYSASLLVDKAAKTIDVENSKIPGQIFTQKKNGQLFYPATGKKKLNKKATGSITIYNNYSSAPQSLVASTRFETPDGKVFRLAEAVTVPGAKVDGGKVTPSSIAAKVVADKGGEDYNIGPVDRFTIPGFRRTLKFDGFYGVSSESMSGGFSGESAYPTEDDIKNAKEKSAATLSDGLKMLIQKEIPEGFKALDYSSKFIVLKQTVNSDVDEKNEFAIFTDAELSMLAFLESDVMSVINAKIKKELSAELKPKTFSLTYGNAELDFAKGKMAVPITYRAQLEYPVDEANLRTQLVGKSELELQSSLFAQPGLANVKVSLWPFWVKRVPKKVDIKVE